MAGLTKKAKGVAAVDGLYRSVRKVIEEGRKVVSIAANAVLDFTLPFRFVAHCVTNSDLERSA